MLITKEWKKILNPVSSYSGCRLTVIDIESDSLI